MGKARGIAKYGLTGAITLVYGAAAYKILTGQQPDKLVSKEKTTFVVGVLAVTTLSIAAL